MALPTDLDISRSVRVMRKVVFAGQGAGGVFAGRFGAGSGWVAAVRGGLESGGRAAEIR